MSARELVPSIVHFSQDYSNAIIIYEYVRMFRVVGGKFLLYMEAC